MLEYYSHLFFFMSWWSNTRFFSWKNIPAILEILLMPNLRAPLSARYSLTTTAGELFTLRASLTVRESSTEKTRDSHLSCWEITQPQTSSLQLPSDSTQVGWKKSWILFQHSLSANLHQVIRGSMGSNRSLSEAHEVKPLLAFLEGRNVHRNCTHCDFKKIERRGFLSKCMD